MVTAEAPVAAATQPQQPLAAPVAPQAAPSAKTTPALVSPVVPVQARPTTPAAGKAILKLTAPQTVAVNEDFQVRVNIANATDMYGGVIAVQFDPALMSFVAAEEGTFLKKDGKPTSFQYTFNKDKGRANLNFTRIGGVGGVSGTGELAVITFKAKGKGSANLGLSDVHVLPPTGSKPLETETFSTVTAIQ